MKAIIARAVFQLYPKSNIKEDPSSLMFAKSKKYCRASL